MEQLSHITKTSYRNYSTLKKMTCRLYKRISPIFGVINFLMAIKSSQGRIVWSQLLLKAWFYLKSVTGGIWGCRRRWKPTLVHLIYFTS